MKYRVQSGSVSYYIINNDYCIIVILRISTKKFTTINTNKSHNYLLSLCIALNELK